MDFAKGLSFRVRDCLDTELVVVKGLQAVKFTRLARFGKELLRAHHAIDVRRWDHSILGRLRCGHR